MATQFQVQKFLVQLTGTHPLLMCNSRAVNKFDPLTRAHSALTGKGSKGRTLEELQEISDTEFQLFVYHDEAIGPYLPGDNLLASFREGAPKYKKGLKPKIELAVSVPEDRIPLEYDGPRDIKALLEDKNFHFVAAVKQGVGKQAPRLMKTRPIFRKWRLSAEVELDTEMIDPDEFEGIVTAAGKFCGIGTYRPRYGRYEAVIKKLKQ